MTSTRLAPTRLPIASLRLGRSTRLASRASLAAMALPLAVLPPRARADGDRADGDRASGFVRDFGPSLRSLCNQPEGIAVDGRGRVYASSFAFAPVANICVLDEDGRVERVLAIPAAPGGIASLLGMLFVPAEGLYVADFADGVAPHGRLLRVDPRSGAAVTVTGGFAAPNGIARDRHGRLYVSASFLGQIVRVRPDGSQREGWAESPRLKTNGQPPFGANGLAFNAGEHFLYVANTGDSTVLRIPVGPGGQAGPVEVFASGAALDAAASGAQALHGADGIAFDARGNLWVCANQANEIQVLSPGGEILARYRGAGAAALDFPASLVFRGRTLYLTNLSLGAAGANSKLSVMEAPFPGAPIH